MRMALIDLDVVLYQSIAGQDQEIQWDEDGPIVPLGSEDQAEEVAHHTILSWADMVGVKPTQRSKGIVLCRSDRSRPKATFRYDVHPKYKQGRTEEKPSMFFTLEEKLCEQYDNRVYRGLEGDDVMGLLGTSHNDAVLCSIDKDIYTVPGQVARFIGDPSLIPVEKINVEQADYYWMYQTLTGDSTDGYLGAPGVGDKGAVAILDPVRDKGFHTMWAAVVQAYETQFEKKRWKAKFVKDNPVQEAIMNAQCARILRTGDYNYDTEEVYLWHPK